MICKYCGKEIPDNSEYCEFCNESLIDKVILDDKALIRAKEARRREESPIFIRAYYKAKETSEEKKLRKEKELAAALEAERTGRKPKKVYTGDPFYKKKQARVLAIVLSALPILTVILSIFLNWQYYLIKSGDGVKQSRSMKAIVSTSLSKDVYSEYAKNRGFANYVPLICMIMLILAAIYILYLAVLDLFPEKKIPKDPLVRRWGFIARIVPVVLIIAAIIIFVHCKMYVNSKNGMMDYHRGYSSLIGFEETGGAEMGKGFGHFLACASPAIYVISKVYVFVINTLNED